MAFETYDGYFHAWLEADENIIGGTSGGPIVDDDGQIIAIVSQAGGSEGKETGGKHSIPSLWLPPWLLKAVTEEE